MYPKGEGAGRPPVGLERMLRIHCLQHWFNLSDPAAEEALYDSRAMRGFVGIDLGREPVPDETTICKFRHLLEAYELGPKILEAINAHLAEKGFRVTTGTIVDATIIAAPSSTKNEKKGNEWHFGMTAHIGVDSATKIIHSVAATAANVHDAAALPDILHGKETRTYGDSDYQREIIRARVEHPFLVIKRIFGFAKVRYRGLKKNAQRLYVACALTNLYLLRRRLAT